LPLWITALVFARLAPPLDASDEEPS